LGPPLFCAWLFLNFFIAGALDTLIFQKEGEDLGSDYVTFHFYLLYPALLFIQYSFVRIVGEYYWQKEQRTGVLKYGWKQYIKEFLVLLFLYGPILILSWFIVK